MISTFTRARNPYIVAVVADPTGGTWDVRFVPSFFIKEESAIFRNARKVAHASAIAIITHDLFQATVDSRNQRCGRVDLLTRFEVNCREESRASAWNRRFADVQKHRFHHSFEDILASLRILVNARHGLGFHDAQRWSFEVRIS